MREKPVARCLCLFASVCVLCVVLSVSVCDGSAAPGICARSTHTTLFTNTLAAYTHVPCRAKVLRSQPMPSFTKSSTFETLCSMFGSPYIADARYQIPHTHMCQVGKGVNPTGRYRGVRAHVALSHSLSCSPIQSRCMLFSLRCGLDLEVFVHMLE